MEIQVTFPWNIPENPFCPLPKEDREESKSSLLIKAHNLSLETPLPSAEIFEKHPSFEKYLVHEHNISKDPWSYYRKDSHYSRGLKAFDLVVGGPLAAAIDLAISAVLSGILAGGFALIGSIVLVRFLVSGGKDTEKFREVADIIVSLAQYLFQTLRSALRVIPVVGVFFSYMALIAANSCKICIESSLNLKASRLN